MTEPRANVVRVENNTLHRWRVIVEGTKRAIAMQKGSRRLEIVRSKQSKPA